MTETAPVDLVRATLEQAWQADCLADIYLARQVVDLRGLLASARSDLVASGQTAARFERERDELDAENLRLREQAGEMALTIERLTRERDVAKELERQALVGMEALNAAGRFGRIG